MTVTQSYSLSLTYSSLRMYVTQTPPAAVPSSQSTPAAPVADTVTLSPESTTPAVVDEVPWSRPAEGSVSGTDTSPEAHAPEAPVETQGPPVDAVPYTPPSRAAHRAEALHDALDRDQDGTITKEEFVEGAMALLRRAGARHHYRHHRVHDEGHDHDSREGHGTSRLERKLDRLFERVDASGDGSVDQAELTDALAKVTRERRPEPTDETPAPTATPETTSEAPSSAPAPSTEAPSAPSAALSYTSVTVVIAVKQYASVAAMSA